MHDIMPKHKGGHLHCLFSAIFLICKLETLSNKNLIKICISRSSPLIGGTTTGLPNWIQPTGHIWWFQDYQVPSAAKPPVFTTFCPISQKHSRRLSSKCLVTIRGWWAIFSLEGHPLCRLVFSILKTRGCIQKCQDFGIVQISDVWIRSNLPV